MGRIILILNMQCMFLVNFAFEDCHILMYYYYIFFLVKATFT